MTDQRQDDAIMRALEATLFATEEPMTVDALASHLGDLDKGSVRDGLKALEQHYSDRGIHLVERGKRWHFRDCARSRPPASPRA